LIDGAANAVYQKFPTPPKCRDLSTAALATNQSAPVISVILAHGYLPLAGGTGPMDEYLLPVLDEINRTFELSNSWYVEALNHIKSNHGLSGQQQPS